MKKLILLILLLTLFLSCYLLPNYYPNFKNRRQNMKKVAFLLDTFIIENTEENNNILYKEDNIDIAEKIILETQNIFNYNNFASGKLIHTSINNSLDNNIRFYLKNNRKLNEENNITKGNILNNNKLNKSGIKSITELYDFLKNNRKRGTNSQNIMYMNMNDITKDIDSNADTFIVIRLLGKNEVFDSKLIIDDTENINFEGPEETKAYIYILTAEGEVIYSDIYFLDKGINQKNAKWHTRKILSSIPGIVIN